MILRFFQFICFIILGRLNPEIETFLNQTTSQFNSILSGFADHYVSHSELERLKETLKPSYIKLKKTWIPKKHRLYNDAQTFLSIYPKMDDVVAKKNSEFVEAEKTRYSTLLSTVDGKSLDDQQQTVVVTGEDYNLVIAGAGSGKTLTIAGKVKYLCEAKGVKPEDILLIAFTRKSAGEMQERIQERLGIQIDANTFHKLGLRIIAEAQNEKPDVDNSLNFFVRQYLSSIIYTKPEEIKLLIEYFAYYLNVPADLEMFESLGEAYDHELGADLETLQSKYAQSQYVTEKGLELKATKLTLQKEQVRSLEEVDIANYLFLNGVKYEYESVYPYPTSDSEHRVYKPDFFLPEYNLYLEHFGINKDGELPWLAPIEAQKYKDSMTWKRELHQKNGTHLIETYSYYSSEGRLLLELERILKENGVEFKQPDFSSIFNAINNDAGGRYFSEFVKLCSTFINLFKSRGLDSDDMVQLKFPDGKKLTPYYQERTRIFLTITSQILFAYNEMLKEKNAIDFSDMINQATNLVKGGYQVHKYKWVIIDEYQDISVARFNLVKAIVDQTGAKLLCVGDDWQSIYRFAGSDITLFTKFDQYFSKPAIMRLEKTYRNSQQLIDITGEFIMRNKNQYKKHLRSEKRMERPLVFISYMDYTVNVVQNAIERVIRDAGEDKTILLLGRTKHEADVFEDSSLFKYDEETGKIIYRNMPDVNIIFLSVHKSKGLEADNVILLNFKNGLLGFPNKISDDMLLGLVLIDSDDFVYAEERRLLYVALTRTRNKAYVLVDNVLPSEFYKEFMSGNQVELDLIHDQFEKVHCPVCKTGNMVIRKNPRYQSSFLGCSNYPRCQYTIKDISILRENRRCPECGGFMIRRCGKRRDGTFYDFYGCSNYPTCNHVQNNQKPIETA